MSVMPAALLAFFTFGVLLAVPGALQPALAQAFALDLAQSGGVASALMTGVGVGVLGSGPLVDRWPRRPLFAAALWASAVALAGAAASASYGQLVVCVALLGVAGGCYETVLNAALPESQPARAAARLSAAHAAATVGAALGAPLLERAARAHGWQAALLAVAALLAAAAALGLATRFPPPPRAARRASAPLSLAALAPFAVVSCAYVGVETTFSALLPAHSEATGAGAAPGVFGFTPGAMAISGFWAGLFAGRVLYARFARRPEARQLVWAGVAGALLLGAGSIHPPGWTWLWSAAVGLALGAVFPVLVVLAGDTAPGRRATALALVVATGSVGGFGLPWLAGALGAAHGTQGAMLALAVSCAALALGAWRSAAPLAVPR